MTGLTISFIFAVAALHPAAAEEAGLQRDAYAGVFQAHREDPFVDLVKLHQLQKVYEQSRAVVYGVVLPPSVLKLQRKQRGEGGGSGLPSHFRGRQKRGNLQG